MCCPSPKLRVSVPVRQSPGAAQAVPGAGHTIRVPGGLHCAGDPPEGPCVRGEAWPSHKAPNARFPCCTPYCTSCFSGDPPPAGSLAFSCPPHPQALFWCVCPFPEPRPLLSFSLQGCSSCDLPGSGRRAPPCLPLSFYSWLDQPLSLSFPGKGCLAGRGVGGPEPRRKPGQKPPPRRTRSSRRSGRAHSVSVIFSSLTF